ncbi:MAG: sulfite exporter TauE/SafE family protein [Bacteroidales bacterium]
MGIEDLLFRYALLILGGALAGFINIIAGAGSLLTLPILIGIGMPAPVANGTNRIAVLLQDLAGTLKFLKKNKLPLQIALKLSVPTVIGAAGGAFLAIGIDELILNVIIMTLLVLMIIYVIWHPGDWTKGASTGKNEKVDPFTFFLFLIIGIYAGFIQAAATLIWFAALMWRMKVDMVAADAIKIFLNLVMTPVALLIFFLHHQVSLFDGLILGAGSFAGGWIGAKAAIRLSPAFVRMLMLVVLGGATLYMLLFKIFHLL